MQGKPNFGPDVESIDTVATTIAEQFAYAGLTPAMEGLWRDWHDSLTRLRTRLVEDVNA